MNLDAVEYKHLFPHEERLTKGTLPFQCPAITMVASVSIKFTLVYKYKLICNVVFPDGVYVGGMLVLATFLRNLCNLFDNSQHHTTLFVS